MASGDEGSGQYKRLWYKQPVGTDEVAFESGVFLLTKARAEQLQVTPGGQTETQAESTETSTAGSEPEPGTSGHPTSPTLPLATREGQKAILRLRGTVPPEAWNRLGTRILPKLRSGDDLSVGVEFSVSVDAGLSQGFQLELEQALADLGLQQQVSVEASQGQ